MAKINESAIDKQLTSIAKDRKLSPDDAYNKMMRIAMKSGMDRKQAEDYLSKYELDERSGMSVDVKDNMKPWKKKKKSRLATELEENYSFPDKYDWIDNKDKRIYNLNKRLNEGYDEKKFIDLLYKNVDLNEPDDFAIEMIIISADEFMGKKLDKKQAKEILNNFDKKYPRARKG